MQITDFAMQLGFVYDKIADISLQFISLLKLRKMISPVRAPTNVILVLAD